LEASLNAVMLVARQSILQANAGEGKAWRTGIAGEKGSEAGAVLIVILNELRVDG